MRSPKEMKILISELNIEPRPELRDEVLTEAIALHKSQSRQKSGNRIWNMIMEKPVRLLPPAIAAIILLALFVGLNKSGVSPDGATTAWANIVKNLYASESVSIVVTRVMDGEDPETEKMWFRLPDHYRHDEDDSTEIDNGIDFLLINHEKKTYRYSPSKNTFEPVADKSFIRFFGLFNNNGDIKEVEGLTAVHNKEDSTKEKMIFDLSYSFEYTENTRKTSTGSGQAVVDPKTMRPLNINVKIINGNGLDVSVNIDANYDLIPEEIFYPDYLEDYKEMEREEGGSVSGKVIDSDGNPVEGAIVEVLEGSGPAALRGPKKYITDQYGRFFYTLPPITVADMGKQAALPVLLRAYKEGNNEVGWVVLSTSEDIKSPGKVGNVKGAFSLIDARDIVMVMEQAGRITGTIVDTDGKPVPDVEVDVFVKPLDGEGNGIKNGNTKYYYQGWHLNKQIDYETYKRYCNVKTDLNGRFDILYIPQFRNKMEIRVFSNKNGYLKDLISMKEDVPFSSKDIQVKLYKKEIKISGVLETQTGKKLGGRFVNLVVDGKRYRNISHTDAEGRFEIEAPANANAAVEVQLSESWFYGIDAEYDRNKYEDVSAEIDYQPGRKEYKVNLVAGKLIEERK